MRNSNFANKSQLANQSFVSNSQNFGQKSKIEQEKLQKMLEIQNNYLSVLKQKIDTTVLQESENSILSKNEKIYNQLANGEIVFNSKNNNLNIVEQNQVNRRLKETEKNRLQMQKQLQDMENEIQGLNQQQIKNYKNVESNPFLKQQILEEEQKRQREAKKMVQKLKKEQLEYEKQKQQRQIQLEKKLEEQQKKEAEIKEEQKKREKEEKELQFKQKREQQQKYLINLKEELSQNQNISKSLDIHQKPLFKQLEKNFQKQIKKEEKDFEQKLKEKHKQFIELTQNYSAKEQKEKQQEYEEKLKLLIEEKRQKREQQMKEFNEKYPAAKVTYKNKRLEQILEEDQEKLKYLNNRLSLEKEKASQRNQYYEKEQKTIFQNLKVNESNALELKIRQDKLNNPQKYIRNKKGITDLQIYLNEVQTVGEAGKSKERGMDYLKQLKVNHSQSTKTISNKLNTPSEKNLKSSFLPHISHNGVTGQIQTGSEFSKDPNLKNQSYIKYNYMDDVRKKYALDSKVNNWRRFMNTNLTYNSDINTPQSSKNAQQKNVKQNNELFLVESSPQQQNARKGVHSYRQLNSNNVSVHSSLNNRKIDYINSLNVKKQKEEMKLKKENLEREIQKNIINEADKLQAKAQRKEQLIRVNIKPGNIKQQDINALDEVDDFYIDSIKAKLALLNNNSVKVIPHKAAKKLLVNDKNKYDFEDNNNIIDQKLQNANIIHNDKNQQIEPIYGKQEYDEDDDDIDNELADIDKELQNLEKQSTPKYNQESDEMFPYNKYEFKQN